MTIAMGQVWEWDEPNGKKRTMLVQRLTDGPPRRVWGIHPESGRVMQVLASTLVRGDRGARLVRVVEGYVWRPTP